MPVGGGRGTTTRRLLIPKTNRTGGIPGGEIFARQCSVVGNSYSDEERADDLFVIIISSEPADVKTKQTCAAASTGKLIN